MIEKDKIEIPEGFVIDNPDDNLRALGLSEKDIAELSEESRRQIANIEPKQCTPEQQKLLDIIYSSNTTYEEQEAARRKLFPENYDEKGNFILKDDDFFEDLETDMKVSIEEMQRKGLVEKD